MPLTPEPLSQIKGLLGAERGKRRGGQSRAGTWASQPADQPAGEATE